MISHAPILTLANKGADLEKTKDGPFHKNFVIDTNFCRTFYHVFGGTTVRVHTKPSTKTKTRQYEFFLLNNFLLGSQFLTCMVTQLELNMHSFSYDGESKGFTLQKIMNLHKEQHIISYGLMEYGYSGVDNNSRVRMIINGINANALDAFKAAILAIPYMQGYFDILESYLLDFFDITPNLQKNATSKESSKTRS